MLGAGAHAVYIAFGQAFGTMNGRFMNVHGAGAQRSDPKSGDPADWAGGFGPQGDEIRIYNHVRCVRGGAEAAATLPRPTELQARAISDTRVRLTWRPAGDAAGFEVQARARGGSWQPAAAGSAGRAVTVRGLVPGTSYRFRVRAVRRDAVSPWSRPARATTLT